MKAIVLLGLVATTAFGRAPDFLAGVIYNENVHEVGSNDAFTTVLSLRMDGTYETVIREQFLWLTVYPDPLTRTIGQRDEGRFRYEKSGPSSATLTLNSTLGQGVVVKNLEFSTASTGTAIISPVFGGGFNIASIDEAPIVNASARGTASASKPLIVGFCVPGLRFRYVLVRAVGPTLAEFDVADAAEDTILEVFGTPTYLGGVVVSGFRNDDWENDTSHLLPEGATSPATTIGAFIGAFPLPEGSKDAALVLEVPPGAYTMIIRTKSETPAEVLGEVYVVP